MTANANLVADDLSTRELVITRTFDAPRQLVFDAWTKPEHVVHWWGPQGFSTTIETMDVRPGGHWIHTMHGPDGVNYPNHSVFLEVTPPARLVYRHGGRREDGPGTSFTSTVTFEEHHGKTTVTMRGLFDTAEEKTHAIATFHADQGGVQTLGRLADYLSQMEPVFSLTRVFDAPRDLVFRAWTEAEHLNHWWGPKGYPTRVLHLDARPGGILHYSSVMPNGQEIFGTFLYREVVAPERLVFLNGFADAQANEARHPMMPDWPRKILNVVTLTENSGKTTLSITGGPHEPTEAERVAFREALKYLTPGFSGTFDQLEAHLAKELGRS